MLYRCSPNNNVIEFNLAYRNGKFVALYTVQTATSKKLLYSILDNGNCLNTTVQDQANILDNTALNFFNETHIALAWRQPPIGTIYKEINLNTGYATNYTLCNGPCYPKLTSNQFGTIIAWTTSPCSTAQIKQNYGQNYQYTVPNVCSDSIDILAIKDTSILAWAQFTDNINSGDIKLQIFNASLQPQTSVITITQESSTEYSPSLAVLSDSSFGLAWDKLPTGNPITAYDVFMQTLNLDGNTISSKTQLNKYTNLDQRRPILAENQGVIAAVWDSIEQDGDGMGIYGKIFFTNGTLIKGEFRINQITTGDQSVARVVAKDDSFVFGYVSQDTINLETFDISPYIEKKKEITHTKTLHGTPRAHTQTLTDTHSKTQTLHDTPRTQTHSNLSASQSMSIPESETLKPSISSTTFQPTNTTEIHSYSHTISQTKTIPPPPPLTTPKVLATQAPKREEAIPEKQKEIAQNTAAGASVASVFTLSTTNVALGSRINNAEKLSSCDSINFQNITFSQPSWSHHPLQFSLGDSQLKYEIGALVGNLVLYVGGVALLTGLSAYFGAPAIFFPGSHALLAAYFFPEIASSSATLIKYGSPGLQIAGSVALAAMGTHSIYYGHFLWTIEATFSISKSKWKAPKGSNGYMKKYGTYFEDYPKSKLEAFPLENLFNIATGFLSGYDPGGISECNNILYSGTALYSGYFLYLLARRPYISTFNNVFYISMAGLQATPLILKTVQVNYQDLKNSTSMNTAIEITPVIANYALAVKSILDIALMIKERSCGTKVLMPNDSESDNEQLLKVLTTNDVTSQIQQHPVLNLPSPCGSSGSSNGMTPSQYNPLNSLISPTTSSPGHNPKPTIKAHIAAFDHHAVNMKIAGSNHHGYDA